MTRPGQAPYSFGHRNSAENRKNVEIEKLPVLKNKGEHDSKSYQAGSDQYRLPRISDMNPLESADEFRDLFGKDWLRRFWSPCQPDCRDSPLNKH